MVVAMILRVVATTTIVSIRLRCLRAPRYMTYALRHIYGHESLRLSNDILTNTRSRVIALLVEALSKWLMRQFFFKFVLYSEYVLVAYIQIRRRSTGHRVL